MKVEVRPNGEALIILAITLIILYALFSDLLILTILASVVIVMTSSLVLGVFRVKYLIREAVVKPSIIELRLIAGSSKRYEVKIECVKSFKVWVTHPLRFCSVKPQPYVINDVLTLEFSPKLAGVYSSDVVWVEVRAPLDAFRLRTQLNLRTNIVVIPRVIPVVIRALEVATALGTTHHEVPTHSIGRGTEYAETREYLPGDDLRFLDWKAIARLQKLMVKEHHRDVGGSVNLVYDLKAAGPITKDVLATQFLRIAITLTEQNIPYNLTIVDGGIKTLRFEDVRTAVLTAVKYALETVEVDSRFLYELVEPHTTKELLKLLDGLELKSVSGFQRDGDFIVITCLLGDLTWLMDIYEEVRIRGRHLVVYVPFKVWLDSPTLEEAYEDYKRQLKLMAMLKKRGIWVETV